MLTEKVKELPAWNKEIYSQYKKTEFEHIINELLCYIYAGILSNEHRTKK